jgi:hypothetical protein
LTFFSKKTCNDHWLCSWYQDRNLDISIIPPTAANENTMHHELPNITALISHHVLGPQSNPLQLQARAQNTSIPTRTIAARTVFHEAQAAIRPLIAGIQTQEQLDALLDSFQGIQ